MFTKEVATKVCEKTEKMKLRTHLLRTIIHRLMREEIGCACPLTFRSGVRTNSASFAAYAQCVIRSHSAKFRFLITESNPHVLEVDVSSNRTLTSHHKDADVMKNCPIPKILNEGNIWSSYCVKLHERYS